MTTDKLAKILWKIHSHSLFPFYVDKIDYEQNWDDLPNHSADEGDVDKEFFLKIAKYINEDE